LAVNVGDGNVLTYSAQAVFATAKMASIVRNDNGVLQQSLMRYRHPQCPFGGNLDWVVRDFEIGEAKRSRWRAQSSELKSCAL
jgi:hypothetical protein